MLPEHKERDEYNREPQMDAECHLLHIRPVEASIPQHSDALIWPASESSENRFLCSNPEFLTQQVWAEGREHTW